MKPLTRLVHFCLEQAAVLPIQRRAALYRDLAQVSPSAKEATAFAAMADDLDAVERRHQQLSLDFKRRSEGQARP